MSWPWYCQRPARRDTPLFRLTVEPDQSNGLRQRSKVMLDKAQTIAREKIGRVIGRLEDGAMLAVNRGVALFLGLA